MQAEILKNGKIAGTRSSVYDVVMYTEGGWQAEQIANILQVTPAQVRAAIQYIEEHREEVMAVHREIEERNARGNPPEVEAKLAETRGKDTGLAKRTPSSQSSGEEIMGLRRPGTEVFGEFGLKITVDHRPAKRGGKNRF